MGKILLNMILFLLYLSRVRFSTGGPGAERAKGKSGERQKQMNFDKKRKPGSRAGGRNANDRKRQLSIKNEAGGKCLWEGKIAVHKGKTGRIYLYLRGG
ncbi:MAG: hypothetical protein DBY39_07385 [Clostridiales bacterium]|nr:MAG: hypothetical protein DBY39_07385 [Clostridiales bacterium]